jgi:hypothetical protein
LPAVEEVRAATAEVSEAYSPVLVPDPLTIEQPVGGVVRAVARTSSSDKANALDKENRARDAVNTVVEKNILIVAEDAKLAPLLLRICLPFDGSPRLACDCAGLGVQFLETFP